MQRYAAIYPVGNRDFNAPPMIERNLVAVLSSSSSLANRKRSEYVHQFCPEMHNKDDHVELTSNSQQQQQQHCRWGNEITVVLTKNELLWTARERRRERQFYFGGSIAFGIMAKDNSIESK